MRPVDSFGQLLPDEVRRPSSSALDLALDRAEPFRAAALRGVGMLTNCGRRRLIVVRLRGLGRGRDEALVHPSPSLRGTENLGLRGGDPGVRLILVRRCCSALLAVAAARWPGPS